LGKLEGKGPQRRPKYRWVANIRMDLLEIGWGGVHLISLAQYKDKLRVLVNVVMNLGVPQNAENFSSGCTTSGLLCSAQLLRVS
jgi:hypothetical protein